MSKWRCRRKAFTLIELLLASVIFVWVGLGVYRSLSSGISVFKWLAAHRSSGEAVIFFDRVAKDLRNYCDIYGPSFEGASNKVSFFVHNPCYLMDDIGRSGANDIIYKVEYVYYPERKEVRRNAYEFGLDKPKAEFLRFSNIESVVFNFHVLDAANHKLLKSSMLAKGIPKAVEIEVGILDSKGAIVKFKRFIEIEVIS